MDPSESDGAAAAAEVAAPIPIPKRKRGRPRTLTDGPCCATTRMRVPLGCCFPIWLICPCCVFCALPSCSEQRAAVALAHGHFDCALCGKRVASSDAFRSVEGGGRVHSICRILMAKRKRRLRDDGQAAQTSEDPVAAAAASTPAALVSASVSPVGGMAAAATPVSAPNSLPLRATSPLAQAPGESAAKRRRTRRSQGQALGADTAAVPSAELPPVA
jgi:hypothetical protein